MPIIRLDPLPVGFDDAGEHVAQLAAPVSDVCLPRAVLPLRFSLLLAPVLVSLLAVAVGSIDLRSKVEVDLHLGAHVVDHAPRLEQVRPPHVVVVHDVRPIAHVDAVCDLAVHVQFGCNPDEMVSVAHEVLSWTVHHDLADAHCQILSGFHVLAGRLLSVRNLDSHDLSFQVKEIRGHEAPGCWD